MIEIMLKEKNKKATSILSLRVLITLLLMHWIASYGIAQSPIYGSKSVHHPIISKNGMVASQHQIASQVGIDILKKGGNAVDAAVTVGFALAVVLPRAGNLGGGGFMMVHLNEENITKAINYRETAPMAATKEMFLDENGQVDTEMYNLSCKSIGVPGSVAGLTHALDHYGTMNLKEVLLPAIELAEEGFPITNDLSQLLIKYENRLSRTPESEKIFFKEDDYYQPGDTLYQQQLAWSLKEISKYGKDAFYKGEITKRILNDLQQNGGILTYEDFSNYEVIVTDPVSGSFNGYEIASMPPPSSGGVHLIQILNILDNFELDSLHHNTAQTIHLLVESMRLAYADRSKYLADPRFYNVPVEGLTSKEYAYKLSQKIDLDSATRSSTVLPGAPYDYESEETTHFSVVDKYGNVVSNTYTLNFSFGTGLIAQGTGILLNNEMGDFAAKVGHADAYGLIGGKENSIIGKATTKLYDAYDSF